MRLQHSLSKVIFFGALIVNIFVGSSMASALTAQAVSDTKAQAVSDTKAQAVSDTKAQAVSDTKTPHVSPHIRPDANKPYVLYRLPNGLTVAFLEDNRFPLVSVRLFIHAGSAYEDKDQTGISHLLEHMVFKGTEAFPKGGISSSIESAGGYLNAATSFDYTVYQTDMPAAKWKIGLAAVQQMAFKAIIDPTELESEKDVVIAELKRGEDNPGSRLFKMTQKQALARTPYEHPIIGYEDVVRNIKAEDIHAYIQRLYQPQSMLLLVTGQVNKEKLLKEVELLFGDLQNSSSVNPPEIIQPAPGFGVRVEEGPWNKVYLTLSFPAPPLSDSRSPELDVLSQLLGGDKTSYLYRKYKYEKRLVDSISSNYYGLERLGMFGIYATLDADKLDEFWAELLKDLPQLTKLTYTDKELARAKLNIEDDLFRSKETLAGLASKAGYFQFFAGGEEGEKNYLRQVNSLDHQRIKALGAEIFRPENLQLTMIAPNAEATTKEDSKSEKNTSPRVQQLSQKLEDTLRKAWPPESEKKSEAQAGSTSDKDKEIIKLDDSRTLILLPDRTMPYTSVTMMLHGGDALLKPSQQGLAAFVASALTRGTAKRGITAIEDFQSDRAASFGVSAGRQSFTLSLSQPTRFNSDLFGMLHEIITQPAFKDEEIARVRENQLSAIKMKEDQPLGLAFRRLFPFLYGEHPYGLMSLGTPESVSGFNRADVLAFWKKQAAQPWVMAVSGDFDRDEIVKMVNELPLPTLKKPEIGKANFQQAKELDLPMPGRNQAHLLMVFKTDAFNSEDTPGLELLDAVLAGQSGLLFRDLRDNQGLGYTVTSMTWQAQEGGFIAFYIGTEPGKMSIAEEGFRRIIQDLKDSPLPLEELVRGKNQLEGDYYRGRQSLASRSGEAASMSLMGYELDRPRRNVELAAKLTSEDLQALAKKYLNLDQVKVVKVLPN